jgi:UDP-N-acetylmuramoyl-tripeptide--D-alanyl-D-alanine ligase
VTAIADAGPGPFVKAPPMMPDGRAEAFSAAELAAAAGGTLVRASERPIRGGAVDSREVRPGNAFVALPGDRTDGHAFLAEATARGAAALVVSRDLDEIGPLGDVTIIRVADGLAALGGIAAAWRMRFQPLVVGVTGSIAKTSTKEAIASVLGSRMHVLRSEGNRNNEIGLPLTILDLASDHEAAVLEMGMYVGGEIADLARIARPSVGVVTAVQGVHLSRIGTLEAIEAAKAELIEALPSADEGGVAVLNADDAIVRRMAGRTTARVITYGFATDADVEATDVASTGFEGMRFVLRAAQERQVVAIPGLGRLAVHNALAAAAVGRIAGLSLADIASGLAAGWQAPHRGEVIRAGGVTIVDDAYNASPGSVAAALDALAGLPGRRVAVLGEMLELGPASEAGHREVGLAAADIADLLVVVGAGAAAIGEAARDAGLPPERLLVVEDRAVALDALLERLRTDDVVLVKASRGAALDLLVAELATRLGPAEAGDRRR